MTRFARARGSKASNERAPEEATPWEVMKEQLLQAKKDSQDATKRKEAEQQRIDNYENFLKERRVAKRPVSWCDFPEIEQDNKNKGSQSNAEQIQSSKKKEKNKHFSEIIVNNSSETNNEVRAPSENNKIKKKKNKKKSESEITSDDNLNKPEVSDEKKGTSKIIKKKKKAKHENLDLQLQGFLNTSQTEILTQPKITKKKKKEKSVSTNDDPNSRLNVSDETSDIKSVKKHKKGQQPLNQNKTIPCSTGNDQPNGDISNKNNVDKKQKKAKPKKKLVDGKPIRRKEINDNSFQLIINGKEVELVRFDGFPIMRRDADRLTDLKNSMIKKGIPKSEVQRTMKLERRRAEKALARLKRDVCYNCRKGGHNLSDCPELKSKIPGVEAADGVCFKCGSTEHRQFECKVQRDKEFRFASCFICKEQGHIARQCPDNPKGLYPNGGSCKLCGDVTHLRKDCPTANTQKESSTFKLQTLDSTDNLEDIGAQTKLIVPEESSKKPKKIKF